MGYSEQVDRFLGLIDFGFDCRTLGGPQRFALSNLDSHSRARGPTFPVGADCAKNCRQGKAHHRSL